MKYDPRGSLWRRWDLHLHSPASFDYGDKTVSPDDMADGLAHHGVRLVAVTDHHVIDTTFISAMQKAGEGRLTVLPGIELRSELGGSECVHYIGIFPDDIDLEDLWIKLQGLGISVADVQSKGNDHVYVPYADGFRLIRELGGIVTVHAGKKTNSIEALTNADVVKQAVKSDLASKYIHALEVGRLDDCPGYRKHVFPDIGRALPLILCSDNHNIRQYSTKCPMWVKADPSFAGLLQLINEPEDRIFLGDEPPSCARVEKKATKYIDSISFERTELAKEGVKWFEGVVQLNHGLVAIIGNKGSGKSALADVAALLGNSRQGRQFAFLTSKRFLEPKGKLGPMFRATCHWRNGSMPSALLSEPPDIDKPETVKYIPQFFLESICADPKDTAFDQELQDVIFSHVSEAERLNCSTLEELIEFLTSSTTDEIEITKRELASSNREIFGTEEQLSERFRASLEALLQHRKSELEAHDQARPSAVAEPSVDPETQAASVATNKELADLREQRTSVANDFQALEVREREAARRVAVAERLQGNLKNLERQFASFTAEASEDAAALGLNLQEIVKLTILQDPLVSVKDAATKELSEVRSMLDPEREESIAQRLAGLDKQIDLKRLELDEPGRKYQSFLTSLRQWEHDRSSIVGSLEDPESLVGLEGRLKALEQLPESLRAERARRDGICRNIARAKLGLLARYMELYRPVQEFIENDRVFAEAEGLQVSATFTSTKVADGLLRFIHQGRIGSFYGDDEGRKRLHELIASADLSTDNGILAFASELERQLNYDFRDGDEKPVSLESQLKAGFEATDVLNYIYSLEYVEPIFELRWQGKPLDKLSPGERGTLLLVFYLLVDRRDTPLVIDQPEENLDNHTIATMLVPAVKSARMRRQVIMVTHNPNIAVVCDADQIVHAERDILDGNAITYTTGSIENPTITQLILDVLEGTKPAFDLRDAKYNILDRAKNNYK
ncbi:MAG: hypothetical protein JST30_14635 [Armatimonadetes bacterium]|nr:hypothetical protein [Armatimonadota bacterium]